MALTRKMLKGMGIEEEKIDLIIDAHVETVDSLKAERDTYKNKVADYDKLKDEVATLKDDSGYKAKYDDLKKEFDDYKDQESVKKVRESKTAALKKLLLDDVHVSNKRVNSILRVSDIDAIELDDEGNIKNSKDLVKSLSTEWSDFIETVTEEGADTPTPPENNGGSKFAEMTLTEKMEYANAHPNSKEVTDWLHS